MLLAAVLAVQARQASFPLAESWAEAQIRQGLAEPADSAHLAAAYRDAYGYRNGAGDWRPFPAGDDSYYYMRLAERVFAEGAPCAGEGCRDDLANAPLGRPLAERYSPHVYALAAGQRLAQLLGGDVTILGTARILGAVLLACAGFLGYRLVLRLAGGGAGAQVGGLLAGLALCLHPAMLARALGADDDVWMLLLSLLAVLFWLRALDGGEGGRRRALAATGAGLAVGVLALAWGGWPFLLAVLLGGGGLAAALALIVARPVPLRPQLAVGAWPLLPLGLGLGILLLAFGSAVEFGSPLAQLGRLLQPQAAEFLAEQPPPDSFASVAELQPLGLVEAAWLLAWPLPLLALAGLVAAAVGQWRRPAARSGLAILLVWTLAGGALLASGERYLTLLVPPLVLLAGCGVASAIGGLAGRRPRAAGLAAAGIASLLLAGLLWRADREVSRSRPDLTSAWVETLAGLRRTTAEDALLLAWWDKGHWASFWARRGVAVDGASLRDPRVHAVGRLLAADADASLAEPLRDAACLEGGLLCPRDETVLLLSSDLLSSDAWMLSGLWDPARARLVDALAFGQEPKDAAAELARRRSLTPEAAAALAAEAATVATRRQRALFAAPQARIWSRGWQGCLLEAGSLLDCRLDIESADGWRLERFAVDLRRPGGARFTIRRSAGRDDGRLLLAPSTIRLATPQQLFELAGAAPGDTNPGVLIDTSRVAEASATGARIFVGTPAMLRSLVVRLLLLEGRYDARRFQPVGAASTVDGRTVQAWRALVSPRAARGTP